MLFHANVTFFKDRPAVFQIDFEDFDTPWLDWIQPGWRDVVVPFPAVIEMAAQGGSGEKIVRVSRAPDDQERERAKYKNCAFHETDVEKPRCLTQVIHSLASFPVVSVLLQCSIPGRSLGRHCRDLRKSKAEIKGRASVHASEANF